MEQTTKTTKIEVMGPEHIMIRSPKGFMPLRLVGGRLVAKAGGKELKLKAGTLAKIVEAAGKYRPPRYENEERMRNFAKRYGSAERAWEAGDEAAAFEMDREPRMIDAGTGEIVIMVGREDLA